MGLDGGDACRCRFVRRDAKKAMPHQKSDVWHWSGYIRLSPNLPAEVFKPGMFLLTSIVACCSFNLCRCNCTLVESSWGVNRKGEMAGCRY